MVQTIEELRRLQAQPLERKVIMTRQRIREWVERWGEDGVYVAFSGGKDSTALLNIVRQDYPNIPAVFSDTGLEYPEIREFVKTFDNVVWLKPKMSFKQVIDKYGYPFFSKEVCESVEAARKYVNRVKGRSGEEEIIHGWYGLADIIGVDRRVDKNNDELMELKRGIIPNKSNFDVPNEQSKRYDKSRYFFMLNAPFEISRRCCSISKKAPQHLFSKQTGRKAITGQMAAESTLRTAQWLKTGCNGFDMKIPISNPMSFWTEQDVLLYIRENNIPICSVYGDIVEDLGGTDEVEGQLTISDLEGFENVKCFDTERRPLKTTGCNRTGCVFCLYGIHLEKSPNRLERLKITHPKLYDYVMRPESEGGLGYKEKIDWVNEHGNMNIKY